MPGIIAWPLLVLLAVAGIWIFVIIPGEEDVVRAKQFDCVLASAQKYHMPLRQESAPASVNQGWDELAFNLYAPQCARLGNPPIGV